VKKKYINYYMSIADLTSKLSYAKKLQVGAVIVKENQILATGYNGTPSGWDNNCEEKIWDQGSGGWLSAEEMISTYPHVGWNELTECEVRYKLKTKPEVLHAEMNALMAVTKSTESSMGASLFCTHSPCIECAKLIYQAGIKSLYYRDQYRDDSGITFLKQGDISVHQYTLPD